MRTTIYLRIVTLTLALVGCDGCEDTTEAPTLGGGTVGAGARPTKLKAPDGTEIVLASAAGDRRREADQRRTEQEREQWILEPNAPDPAGGEFSLEQAVADMPIDGELVAEIRTDLGTLLCDLHADRAPKTVANFIGLARGIRPWWNPKAGSWVEGESLYDNMPIFRVVPGEFVQTGDILGDGTGWVGYHLDDEIHESLRRHDQAGQLVVASRGPDENGGQFLITDGPNPELDGGFPIFGQCQPTDVVERLSRVPQAEANRPITPLMVHRVIIRRVAGGADAARPLRPALPDGYDPANPSRGASPGPAELDLGTQIERRRQAYEEEGRELPEL